MKDQYSVMDNSNLYNQSVQNQYFQNPNTNSQGLNMNNFDMQRQNLKFCKFCGEKIPMDAVICVKCGRQVEELKSSSAQPNIIINNDNSSRNTSGAYNMGYNMYPRAPKNKVAAILLCLFLGYIGAHKFYEGKVGMGLLYLFTGGLCGIGILIDLIILIFKPSVYYV